MRHERLPASQRLGRRRLGGRRRSSWSRIKVWALAATGALSVAASLADSALDLIASSAGLVGILYAAKPPDEDHSFGHSSAEDLVALGQALLVHRLGRADRLERACGGSPRRSRCSAEARGARG